MKIEWEEHDIFTIDKEESEEIQNDMSRAVSSAINKHDHKGFFKQNGMSPAFQLS
jgi:hypothetical protein